MSDVSVRSLLDAAVLGVGGAERAGQVRMAEAVADAMETGEHLLVQAGTGTGKSLAYLVPSLAHGERVVVATATIALQGQIVDRDLPRVIDAVAPLLDRRPTYAMLKGRRNYVCKNKLAGAMPDADGDALFAPAPTTPLGRDVLRLRDWAEETDTGDRDDLVPGVQDRAWSQVAVSARECIGAQKCPYGDECFAEQARAQAAEADIVVTNHALLAIDAIQGYAVLPAHDVVVVDEAHELVDRVTGVATDELAPGAVERAVRASRRLAGDSAADSLEEAGTAFGAALAESPVGRLPVLPDSLVAAVVLVRDAARAVQSALTGAADDDGGRTVARAAVDAVHEVAERVAAHGAHDVVWVSEESRRGRVLRVAPLSVSGLLREKLFAERTVVLTSATLQLGGSFDSVARSVGLLGPGSSGWQGLDVGSPFDYPRQAILYVARHLPPPGRDSMSERVLDELEELVRAAGGRTLGLFSSMRAAETATAELRERLDVPVLCQGEDSTAELVRRFAADAPTCLFGTMSLWQGVDVPGSALQLVVIDRIPFPRPDDPLMSARAEAAGPAGFMTVSAAHAALRLAQGSGRLVRGLTDRGVVAVLDSRLATARYGTFLRSSLPPFWYTTDRAAALAALARIDASAPPPQPVGPRVKRAAAPAAPVVPPPSPPSERVAVVLGKAWTEDEDGLLMLGLQAGRSLEQLAERHECTVEQLVARMDTLRLDVPLH